ncbi:glycosyltransferase [Sphingomonas sp. Y38-1Y]|uniref:glycosyltransferase n=1 Tax=Sphingomonas sp. Y38-1Y TaxID=3078265 RepID=UPI0028EB9E3A|nr:glycosyltransferase [Sphingomonas sp. Y38-1Y]
MRIAILAHLRQPIAEPFAGGMESHCWHLVRGLADRGHEVVLFASGDSDAAFTIDPVVQEHYERAFPWHVYRGSAVLTGYLDAAYGAACDRIERGGFEVVHNNSLHRFPLEPRRTAKVPTVTSLHVPPYDALHWFVNASATPGHRLTVTSRRQLDAWWPSGAPPEASVLHNGIDPSRWPFVANGNGEAVWCGRLAPNKGPHLAIDAARLAGIPLTLFGAIEDTDYFAAEVRPRLGSSIRYGGHLNGAALAAELGRASVFVFTPCWDEPFGLVAIEAMACGLPVAAFDMGAASEVVGDGGVMAAPNDVQALAKSIVGALAIPRHVPHDRVRRCFTHDIWLNGCEALYRAASTNSRNT